MDNSLKNHTALSRKIEVGSFGHALRLVCPRTSYTDCFYKVWQVDLSYNHTRIPTELSNFLWLYLDQMNIKNVWF
jgi:hypothetical protein